MRHPHARWTSALMLSTLAATGIAFVGRGAEAQESKDVVTVQARILQNGVPVNADLDLTFEVWTLSSGGQLLWQESQTAVPVRNGILAVSLGTTTLLGDTFKHGFVTNNSERWLAVKQGGTEIVPRIRLTAVPYAQFAGTADVASRLWDGTNYLTLSQLAGAGLTGGGGNALAVGADNGITVNADSVAVNAGAGLTFSGTQLVVNAGALVSGGSAEVDADRLELDFGPANYTPTFTGTGGHASAATDLTAHLKGIDNALAGGGTVAPQSAGGRLSASSSDPVPMTDTTSSSLYYLPYLDDRIALYDGTKWVLRSIGTSVTASVTTLTTTATPVYDVFLYYHSSGAPAFTFTKWSSNTARTTALARQDGVWVMSGAPTQRYVGTIYVVNSSGIKVQDALRARFIWNAQNRVRNEDHSYDSTSQWTFSTLTWTTINGGNAAWKHAFVQGLATEPVAGRLQLYVSDSWFQVGMTLDGSGIPTRSLCTFGYGTQCASMFAGSSGIGYHYLQGVNCYANGNAGGTIGTAYGTQTGTQGASGITYRYSGMTVSHWR